MREALQQRIWQELDYEANRKGSPEGFSALPPIPAGRYTDPAFLALEQEHVFGKSWLAVAREEDFPQTGSFLVWKKLDKPVLLVRGKDGQVRAFYNTCRHRGAAVARHPPLGRERNAPGPASLVDRPFLFASAARLQPRHVSRIARQRRVTASARSAEPASA